MHPKLEQFARTYIKGILLRLPKSNRFDFMHDMNMVPAEAHDTNPEDIVARLPVRNLDWAMNAADIYMKKQLVEIALTPSAMTEFMDIFDRFTTIGRLLVFPDKYGRYGKISIYLLPRGEEPVISSDGRLSNNNKVKLFGEVIDDDGFETGQWAWFYHGKWQDDFNEYVKDQLELKQECRKETLDDIGLYEKNEEQRIQILLADY